MITTHVISLELAKQLKEIGYPQDSEFYWTFDKYRNLWEVIYYQDKATLEKDYSDVSVRYDLFAAPLATELVDTVKSQVGEHFNISVNCVGECYLASHPYISFKRSTLPDALALMVLELHKRGILTFDKKV